MEEVVHEENETGLKHIFVLFILFFLTKDSSTANVRYFFPSKLFWLIARLQLFLNSVRIFFHFSVV